MPPRKPKRIRFTLGYDSYSVEGETDKILEFRFASPPLARAAFRTHFAKAKKRKSLAAEDVTRIPPRLADHGERIQLDWDGDHVRRLWVTAEESHDHPPLETASALALHALGDPALRLDTLGVGLERWSDSHKVCVDHVLSTLPAVRPALRALALGEYANEGGHILKVEKPARIAELYPELASLRITTTTLAAIPALPLEQLALHANNFDAAAFAALDRPWPKLTALAAGWRRGSDTIDAWQWLVSGKRTPALRDLVLTGTSVDGALLRALAGSPILSKLRTLELHAAADRNGVASALRQHAEAFAHLEKLELPGDMRVSGIDALRVSYRVVPSME